MNAAKKKWMSEWRKEKWSREGGESFFCSLSGIGKEVVVNCDWSFLLFLHFWTTHQKQTAKGTHAVMRSFICQPKRPNQIRRLYCSTWFVYFSVLRWPCPADISYHLIVLQIFCGTSMVIAPNVELSTGVSWCRSLDEPSYCMIVATRNSATTFAA